jgi:hypothetical protein
MNASDGRPQMTAEQFKQLLDAMARLKTDKQLLARMAELEKKKRGPLGKATRHELAALRAEAMRRGILQVSKRAGLKQRRRDAIARGAFDAEIKRKAYREEISRRERGKVADIGVTEASPILRGETYAAQKESTWRVKKRPTG